MFTSHTWSRREIWCLMCYDWWLNKLRRPSMWCRPSSSLLLGPLMWRWRPLLCYSCWCPSHPSFSSTVGTKLAISYKSIPHIIITAPNFVILVTYFYKEYLSSKITLTHSYFSLYLCELEMPVKYLAIVYPVASSITDDLYEWGTSAPELSVQQTLDESFLLPFPPRNNNNTCMDS